MRRLRLRGFDYSIPATYFITLVTSDRRPLFGVVRDGAVELSPMGCLVSEYWRRTEVVIPGVRLGPFIVMPDHFHALLDLPEMDGSRGRTLGSIVGAFKAAVTRAARVKPGSPWQGQFHDRIIRSRAELERCEEYIALNPERWERGEKIDWATAIRGKEKHQEPGP